VLSANRVVMWGGIPLGALAGGAIADWTSVPIAFLLSGLAQLAVVIMIRRLAVRNRSLIADSFRT
jgi:uncharacterized membrane protein AbrB (regulator of aidB expression)